MHVVEMAAPGGPDVLKPTERALPEPGTGEVRVRAHAIGVSSADMMIRRGVYNWMPKLPAVPGNEMAGVVEALGADVTSVAVGARVLVSSRELPSRGGCYAEAICVPAAALFHLPDAVSFESGVCLPNYQLANALLTASGIRTPRSIVVYGASGGVGLALLQLAKASGIFCIGVVSSHDKQAFVQAAGIEHVLLRNASLQDEVMRITGGLGVDVVFGHAGPAFIQNLDLLAPLGTLLSFSHLGGFMPDADFYAELRARLGKSLGVRVYSIHTLDEDAVLRRKLLVDAIERMAAGKIPPAVCVPFPLSRAGNAHAAMESRTVMGKIVLLPD